MDVGHCDSSEGKKRNRNEDEFMIRSRQKKVKEEERATISLL